MKDRIALRMVEDAERDGLLKQVDEGGVGEDGEDGEDGKKDHLESLQKEP